MTKAMTIDAGFWDRLAPRYALKPVPDEEAYRTTLTIVRGYLRPEDTVLELGCGTGTTALHLGPSVEHYLATDVSPKMIEIARRKAKEARVDNVQFCTGTLDDTSLPPEGFDVVMAFNLIHLLHDIPAAVTRATSLLKPGGILLTKTPCVGEYNPLLRGVFQMMRVFGKAPYVNFVTDEKPRDAMNGAGLATLETGLYPTKGHCLFVAARKAQT